MACLTINFLADALKRTVTINVVLPTDKMVLPNEYIPEMKPLKTLYLLDGYTGNYSGILNYTHVQAFAEDYNLAVVMIGGDNKWYSDSVKSGDYYSKFICEDLIEYTRAIFPLSHKREDTFIGGFSMGGYGALVNGLKHPETFGYITAFSSALTKARILDASNVAEMDVYTIDNYLAIFGLDKIEDFDGCDSDYEGVAQKLAANQDAVKPKILITCGENDAPKNRNMEFHKMLVSLGYDATMEVLPGRGHHWTALDSALEKAMEFLPLDGGFRRNIPESPYDANFSIDAFMHWRPYYKVAKKAEND